MTAEETLAQWTEEFNAVRQKTGPLRAIGSVIHSGRQLATAEARIVGPDGKLYAHGSTTCLVFEVQPRTG